MTRRFVVTNLRQTPASSMNGLLRPLATSRTASRNDPPPGRFWDRRSSPPPPVHAELRLRAARTACARAQVVAARPAPLGAHVHGHTKWSCTCRRRTRIHCLAGDLNQHSAPAPEDSAVSRASRSPTAKSPPIAVPGRPHTRFTGNQCPSRRRSTDGRWAWPFTVTPSESWSLQGGLMRIGVRIWCRRAYRKIRRTF